MEGIINRDKEAAVHIRSVAMAGICSSIVRSLPLNFGNRVSPHLALSAFRFYLLSVLIQYQFIF